MKSKLVGIVVLLIGSLHFLSVLTVLTVNPLTWLAGLTAFLIGSALIWYGIQLIKQ